MTVADSMKKKIFAEIARILEEDLDWISLVNYENIKLGFDGFLAHELPAIQIIDQANVRDPERSRDLNTWIILLQVVMKNQSLDAVNQFLLFDRMNDIISLLGQNTVLNIDTDVQGESFLSMRPLGEVTDLHSEQPFYLAELTVETKFYTATRGAC
jgi:hypothetical protein